MFTQQQADLIEMALKSHWQVAVDFARNIKKQGFMSAAQHTALRNIVNNTRPWSSRRHKSSKAEFGENDHCEVFDGHLW